MTDTVKASAAATAQGLRDSVHSSNGPEESGLGRDTLYKAIHQGRLKAPQARPVHHSAGQRPADVPRVAAGME